MRWQGLGNWLWDVLQAYYPLQNLRGLLFYSVLGLAGVGRLAAAYFLTEVRRNAGIAAWILRRCVSGRSLGNVAVDRCHDALEWWLSPGVIDVTIQDVRTGGLDCA
jgi:hypothetical protein